MSDEPIDPEVDVENGADLPDLPDEENDRSAVEKQGSNDYFRAMMDRNFLEYASYVIGSRAIPDVDDGLKPVQRRIMWALYLAYENGKTIKTANIVGNTMHFHPHGDASIGDALVVLANKGGCIPVQVKEKGVEKTSYVQVPYYIKTQGNFGNILTGSRAAASRYTECTLTKLAYETLFNDDITTFIPNYDGRKQEPVVLPAKLPSLLMLGSDGIAVGMSTTILPHNFNELIDAEIAELKGESFRLYPDFQQGGVMDVREYDDGNGKITLRAKIDIENRELVIREIPAVCTTESLIASIEKAAEKNKIRISDIGNFTTDHVEIRITPTRGYDPEKTLQGLYMYTDCSVSISAKLVVICDHRPRQMSVTEVIKRNTAKLLDYLKREFEIELERQNDLRQAKTLAQIFFENRIYKRIEECPDLESTYREVFAGLEPFRSKLFRDVTTDDIDKLLALPVRRIARFDIEKNQRELREIAEKIKEIKHHLAHLVDYAISYLIGIKDKYGKDFPRHTEIENIEQIDRTKAALNNIKIGWDRRNGYVGTAVKSDDTFVCNEFDRFVCIAKNGKYRVIPLPPEKLFVDRLYDFRRYDANVEYGIIYREKKSGKYYGKRSSFGGYILEKEYQLIPPGAVLELFTPRADAIYTIAEVDKKGKEVLSELNLMELPRRSAKARGILLFSRKVNKITHQRYLTEDELVAFQTEKASAVDSDDSDSIEEEIAEEIVTMPETTPVVETPAAEENIPETPVGEEAVAVEETTVEEAPVEPVEVAELKEEQPVAVAEDNAVSEVVPEKKNRKSSGRKKSAKAVEKEKIVEPEAVPEKIEQTPEAPVQETKIVEEVPAQVESAKDNIDTDVDAQSAEPSEAKSADKKSKKSKKDDDDDNDGGDEFGIIQPEFGF